MNGTRLLLIKPYAVCGSVAVQGLPIEGHKLVGPRLSPLLGLGRPLHATQQAQVERFGVVFGLIPRPPDDEDDEWWVIM